MKNNDGVAPLFGSRFLRGAKQRLGCWFIPRLPVNRHTFNHLRREMNAWWVRVNNRINPVYIFTRRAVTSGQHLSVNVASGPTGKAGWVNLDLMRYANVALRYDCRRGLPFRSDSVARIKCEHFLEHLTPPEAADFLSSCYSVLEKNGCLRVIVPDAGRYLEAYCAKDSQAWRTLGWDMEHLPENMLTGMDIINHVFRQDEEHMYAYDFETLSALLKKIGFSRVQPAAFGVCFDPLLCDDEPVHKTYSLYVDAIK